MAVANALVKATGEHCELMVSFASSVEAAPSPQRRSSFEPLHRVMPFDEVTQLRERNQRLEEENQELRQQSLRHDERIQRLEEENQQLRQMRTIQLA